MFTFKPGFLFLLYFGLQISSNLSDEVHILCTVLLSGKHIILIFSNLVLLVLVLFLLV